VADQGHPAIAVTTIHGVMVAEIAEIVSRAIRAVSGLMGPQTQDKVADKTAAHIPADGRNSIVASWSRTESPHVKHVMAAI